MTRAETNEATKLPMVLPRVLVFAFIFFKTTRGEKQHQRDLDFSGRDEGLKSFTFGEDENDWEDPLTVQLLLDDDDEEGPERSYFFEYDEADVHNTQRYLKGMRNFLPLSCNLDIETVDCTLAKSYSLYTQIKKARGREVVVPCGQCATWDLPHSRVTELPGGLNVIGKLHVPTGSSGTLRTRNVYVQGIVQIDPPPPGHTVKVLLYGDEPRIFKPHIDNAHNCGSDGCLMSKKPFIIAGGRLDVSGLASPKKFSPWSKLKDVRRNPDTDEINEIIVEPQAARSWQVGDEIAFSSPVMQHNWIQTSFIQSKGKRPGSLVLGERIDEIFSEATEAANPDRPYFAVEVFSLSRRIIFDAESDNMEDGRFMGGTLKFFFTMSVTQKLEGVLINNFGQQSNLGEYPVHFHMCGDQGNGKGGRSLISKNVIRNSNQRCVVIHGTQNVDVKDNVAYEIFGHCYVTEDGIEFGNVFQGNLGCRVNRPKHLIKGENDNNVSVFWTTNANNTWVGNVATTTEGNGFWFDTRHAVRGPSYPMNRNYNPQSTNLGAFRDNIVHSCKDRGIILYPPGWQPNEENVLEKNIVYQCRFSGYLLHGSKNILVKGGVVSDCGKGILNFRASNTRVEDIEIIGYSENYERIVRKSGTWWYCRSGGTINGMTIHTWRNFPKTTTVGTITNNVSFSRFGPETGCTHNDTSAISMSVIQSIDFYDTPNMFSNLTFNGEMKRLEVCKAPKMGITNMNIEDVDGTLSPTGNRGFFVSKDPALTSFADGTGCTTVSNTCDLAFCEWACLQQVTFSTNNAFSTESIDMMISDGTGKIERGKWHHSSFVKQPRELTSNRSSGKYSATLPFAHFQISFWDSLRGTLTWPDYVEMEYEERPRCADSLEANQTISLLMPKRTRARCYDLIKQGKFEDGNINAWQQSGATLSLTSPGAKGSSYALSITDRKYGIFSQFLDVSCFVEAGPENGFPNYSFSADLKMVSGLDGGLITTCDLGKDCPVVDIIFEKWDTVRKRRRQNFKMPLATVTSSKAGRGGWYQIQGEISLALTHDEALSSRVQIRVREPPFVNFVIDNVAMRDEAMERYGVRGYRETRDGD